MMDIRKQPSSTPTPPSKIRNYNEVVEYLDAHWSIEKDPTLTRAKHLDAALGHPSKKVNAILIAGTNGKSITTHLTAKLLQTEGLKVGAFYAPHILTYNERFVLNAEAVANKAFTDIGNQVISTLESLDIEAHSSEILTLMALHYFSSKKVDVAIMEVHDRGAHDPVNICNALIATVTRIAASDVLATPEQVTAKLVETMGIVKKGTWFIAGDQNKQNLLDMEELTKTRGGNWVMPIRKLIGLQYPFEQLHGRCAALAERAAQMFMEHFFNKSATITTISLLSKPKGKRGRPTLEVKRKLELEPHKTLEQFWKEELNELPGRFQILEKEKPPVLLDNASNLDALENILLGIRLTHYQRPLKGIAMIIAAAKDTLHSEQFLKFVRYFFKKNTGQLFICPLENPLPGQNEDESWDVEKVTNDVKSMKVRAQSCQNFQEAFELATSVVDSREGLIVITGSQSILQTYWHHKGIKKLS